MGSCSLHMSSHWGRGRIQQHEVPSVGIPQSQCVEVMTEHACVEYCCPPCQSHICCFCHCRTCPCAWRRKRCVLQCHSCLTTPWLRGSIFPGEMASCSLWSQVPRVMKFLLLVFHDSSSLWEQLGAFSMVWGDLCLSSFGTVG